MACLSQPLGSLDGNTSLRRLGSSVERPRLSNAARRRERLRRNVATHSFFIGERGDMTAAASCCDDDPFQLYAHRVLVKAHLA